MSAVYSGHTRGDLSVHILSRAHDRPSWMDFVCWTPIRVLSSEISLLLTIADRMFEVHSYSLHVSLVFLGQMPSYWWPFSTRTDTWSTIFEWIHTLYALRPDAELLVFLIGTRHASPRSWGTALHYTDQWCVHTIAKVAWLCVLLLAYAWVGYDACTSFPCSI